MTEKPKRVFSSTPHININYNEVHNVCFETNFSELMYEIFIMLYAEKSQIILIYIRDIFIQYFW